MMNSQSMVDLLLSAGAVDEGSLGYSNYNQDPLSNVLPHSFLSEKQFNTINCQQDKIRNAWCKLGNGRTS